MQKYNGITDERVENLFEKMGYGICVEDIVKTYETIEDFEVAASKYAATDGFEKEIIDELSTLIIKRAQLFKGQQRHDIAIIDVGKFRLVYSPNTIRD